MLAEKVKVNVLLGLKKYKLSIFEYFNLTELYFNKYFYDLEYPTNIENMINTYF